MKPVKADPPIKRDVTLSRDRDGEGKIWFALRCACHEYRYARRSTLAEARQLAASSGWRIVEERLA